MSDHELTEAERISLKDELNTLVNSNGWRWFEHQVQRLAEAKKMSIMTIPADENMPMKVAAERGAYQVLMQVLGLPKHTIDSLKN
jgi:hypothetical protein